MNENCFLAVESQSALVLIKRKRENFFLVVEKLLVSKEILSQSIHKKLGYVPLTQISRSSISGFSQPG